MKDFVVLMDTVGDLSPELLEREEVETIPLTLRFDNEELVTYGIFETQYEDEIARDHEVKV